MTMFQTPEQIQATIDTIRADLTYRHDGPVTLFVLCARACRKSMRDPGYVMEIAEALHDAIEAHDYVDAPDTNRNTTDGE